jgi:multiple RNA-binding domain-containing protein 1
MSTAGVESSRLFVKNLPPNITEADFRKHFATGGREVTDIKLIPKRRIGYVGYKTPEDAAKAVKLFHRSYIRLSKISVEIARPISDPSLPTARKVAPRVQNKLPTPEPEPRAKETDANGKKRKREDVEESDPKLKEYLDIMRPGQATSSKLEGIYGQQPGEQNDVEMAVVPADAESDDEYETIPVKKPKHREEAVEQSPSVQVHVPPPAVQPPQDIDQDMPDAKGPADATDDDWLRSRTNRLLDLVDPDDHSALPRPPAPPTETPAATTRPSPSAEAQSERAPSEAPSEPVVEKTGEEAATEQVLRTGRLFVRNLPFKATEAELAKHFQKYGETEEVSKLLFLFISLETPTRRGDEPMIGTSYAKRHMIIFWVDYFSRCFDLSERRILWVILFHFDQNSTR